MASPVKRFAPNDFDDIDSENIDPLAFASPSKKARGFDFQLAKPAKAPLYHLTPARTPAQYVERAQAAGQKRKAEDDTATPSNDAHANKRAQPSSAPAGRSPKSKKAGILSRRRMTASPFTRINPPTSSTADTNAGLPFSIDAALAGTVPAYKTKSKSKSSHRKGWQFEIHEDTPEDEMANLMEHSTCTLDISDDESRAVSKEDRDNKENIPPVEGAAGRLSTQISATRRDMMTDEPRTPLGDLDAQDFFAEGCDSSSVFIVDPEEIIEDANKKCTAISNVPESNCSTRPRANAVTDNWEEIMSQLAAKASDADPGNQLTLPSSKVGADTGDIQVWESESAKGDEEPEVQAPVVDDVDHQPVLASSLT